MTGTLAYAKWLAAGCPRPTPAQLADRMNACLECPHRSKVTCDACGCPLVRTVLGVDLGKLSMATEACPLPEPRWEAVDLSGTRS